VPPERETQRTVDDDDDLVRALRRRAEEAVSDAEARARDAAVTVAEAHELRRRSQLLRTLVHSLQDDPHHLPRHCAWCRRIEVDGEFVPLEEFLHGDLPLRLRRRATHGICPDCLALHVGTSGSIRQN
jgi:hypothetical protein